MFDEDLPLEQLVPIARLAVLRILDLQPPGHCCRVVDSIRPLRNDAFEVSRANNPVGVYPSLLECALLRGCLLL